MNENSLLTLLGEHDDRAWAGVVDSLAASIHEVDREATRIWFAFHPLVLARALARAKDPERLARRLQLQGVFRLADQIDTSHVFLYGHRYWPAVKKAVGEAAAAGEAGAPLADVIRRTAATAATAAGAEASLVTGITAVAFMTLAQVGLEAFRAAPGGVHLDARVAARSAAEVVEARRRPRRRGLLGLLRTVDKRFTVTFDENAPGSTFESLECQDLAMAGANDTRDYKTKDPRRVEGPIPVECRTAACGTCWVGVVGGAENLSPVDDREWRKMKEFGYVDTDDPKPLVRLACRAKTHGPVSIVVPPWNGVFGKLVDGKFEIDEEPASATQATEARP
jgi:ferredoxin